MKIRIILRVYDSDFVNHIYDSYLWLRLMTQTYNSEFITQNEWFGICDSDYYWMTYIAQFRGAREQETKNIVWHPAEKLINYLQFFFIFIMCKRIYNNLQLKINSLIYPRRKLWRVTNFPLLSSKQFINSPRPS